ncbi:MAG: hypothetical protein HKN23_11505 [Verrucomicrobiales bacterium]|nr:hypothetical protein [Verrucomicrobiales bacterium]
MSAETRHQFEYKPRARVMILAILFFGACAVVLTKVALENDEGAVINGLIHLSPQGATILYWVLTACSLAFVVIGALALIQWVSGTAPLILDRDGVSLPVGFWKKQTRLIPWTEIDDLREVSVQKHLFLYLYTREKKWCVNSSFMTTEDYEATKAIILFGFDGVHGSSSDTGDAASNPN